VSVVRGDVAEGDLGLSSELTGVDSIVHCAANVGWAAPPEVLAGANVEGTKRVAALAKRLGARLHHVSTSSVVNTAARQLPYVASKVRAEHAVLQADVPARIWRVGLLSGRMADGRFPVNPEENGLLLLLSAVLGQEQVPQGLEQAAVELTPVDVCAGFLVRLILSATGGEPLVTLYSDKPVPIGTVSSLRGTVPPPSSRALPVALLSQIFKAHLEGDADPVLPSTRVLLDREGLSWPLLGADYLRRFLSGFTG
jgi:nucleoside-diphosphate-sugar epimerase